MKKTTFLVAIAAVAGLASCTAQSPKANLNTDIDSLSYAIGMARTEGLMQHLVYQMQVDTAYMNDFMKGFNEGATKTSAKDNAYLAGIQIGQLVGTHWINQLNQQMFAGDSTLQISKDNMLAGFVAGVNGKTNVMTMQQAQTYQQTESQRIVSQANAKKYADIKAAGEQFLAQNKTKEGVVTTESGLQYKVITPGKGAIPTESSKVRVNYKGTLIDGTEFDNSARHGNDPATFQPNQVIKGWTEALTMMPVGSKWELYIPQELAYGDAGSGQQIKPYSALIFEVELVGIDK